MRGRVGSPYLRLDGTGRLDGLRLGYRVASVRSGTPGGRGELDLYGRQGRRDGETAAMVTWRVRW